VSLFVTFFAKRLCQSKQHSRVHLLAPFKGPTDVLFINIEKSQIVNYALVKNGQFIHAFWSILKVYTFLAKIRKLICILFLWQYFVARCCQDPFHKCRCSWHFLRKDFAKVSNTQEYIHWPLLKGQLMYFLSILKKAKKPSIH